MNSKEEEERAMIDAMSNLYIAIYTAALHDILNEEI